MSLSTRLTDIKAVIFDLDGTLIDSITPFYGLVVDIFNGIGLQPPSREIINDMLGNGLSIMESMIPQNIENRNSLLQKGREIGFGLWQRFQQEQLKPFPDTWKTLEKLKEKKFLRGIATSGDTKYLKYLVERGLLPLLEATVTKEEVSRLKPAPDIILECLNRLGCPAEGAVYVGDSPIDIKAGKAAGVKTIAVLTGTGNYDNLTIEGPEAIIPDISHLLNVLGLQAL